jgi:hypothetical protein
MTMAEKVKIYTHEGVNLYVGAKIKDKNGFHWEIIWCGPKMVKFILFEHPYDVPHYTAHWYFVENVIMRGYLSSPSAIASAIKRSSGRMK